MAMAQPKPSSLPTIPALSISMRWRRKGRRSRPTWPESQSPYWPPENRQRERRARPGHRFASGAARAGAQQSALRKPEPNGSLMGRRGWHLARSRKMGEGCFRIGRGCRHTGSRARRENRGGTGQPAGAKCLRGRTERNPGAGRLSSQPPAKLAAPIDGREESAMISEMQIHVIARQMFEKHGAEAIYQAAQNAIACENKGDTEEAREWRHLEEAMKMMRGPHQP